MNTLSLYAMAKEYEQAFLELADMDIPEDAINDTLEAMEGELSKKIVNVGAFIKNLEAEAEKIEAVEKAIAVRRKSYKAKAERMKDYLRHHMAETGIKKVNADDGTFAVTLIAPRPSLIIDDNDKVPKKYISERIVLDIDKDTIKKELVSGADFDFAHIEYKHGIKIG